MILVLSCLLLLTLEASGFVSSHLKTAATQNALRSRAVSLQHSVGCEVQVFEDAAELEENLAQDFVDNAIQSISERGSFCAAVPGGSVLKMLRALVPLKSEVDVDWSKVFLYYVNHKIVPATDTGGTHTKALSLFVNDCGIPPQQQFAPSLEADVMSLTKEQHASRYSDHIAQNVPLNKESGLPEFDYMLIGSGSDGHIGSLYPNREEVKVDSFSKASWVLSVDKKDPPSITLSLPVMNAAREIRVVMTGESKSETVTKGVMKLESPEMFPVCGVKGEVWMIDESCARGLDEHLKDDDEDFEDHDDE